MTLDLRQIKYFVALFEEQSITKSAQRLHVVQPAVSMQIRRIELDHGIPLFDRTSSGVYPNEAAKSVYPACLSVLKKVEAIRDTLRGFSGSLTGTLAIGIPPSIAQGILPSVLENFHMAYPDIHLSICEGYSAHLIDRLLQGDLDLAILSEEDGDVRLQCQPIFTEELRVLVAENGTFDQETIRGDQLATLKLILPSSKNLIRILIETEFHKHKIPLQPEIEIDSLSTVIAMVRQPGWATVLPASVMGGAHIEKGLRSIRLIEPNITRTLVATSSRLKPPPAASALFLDAIDDALGKSAHAVKGRITMNDKSHQNKLVD